MRNESTYFEEHNDPLARRITTGLGKLATALRHRAWQEAMPRGLTPTQGQVLTLLAGRPGLALGEVAAALGSTAATASDAVRVLAGKELVVKSRRPGDGRTLSLSLTTAGRAAATAAAGWPDFLSTAVDELDEEERRVLLKVILRLIRGLQVRGEISVASTCVTCRYFRPRVHDDDRSHHCALVDAPFGDADLRIDCAEHEPAPEAEAEHIWRRFTAVAS